MRTLLTARPGILALSLALWAPALAGEVAFIIKPAATTDGDKVKISFTISAPTDVEVCILASDGKEVRHLAAGVLGAKNPPPEPLKPGLAQTLEWDMRDDLKKPAAGGPFKVRVRAGTSVKFSRFLGGEDPYSFGVVASMISDADGNIYVMGFKNEDLLGAMTLRQFSPEGKYLKTIMPFPADLEPGAMKDVAPWDAPGKCFRPVNYANTNPQFYYPIGRSAGPMGLIAVTKDKGILLTDGKSSVCALDSRGAVPGDKFVARGLWEKPFEGGCGYHGAIHAALSPDGNFLYISGFYSAKNGPYKYNPLYPPGIVYRLALDGKGFAEPFITVKGDWDKDGAGGNWKKDGGAYDGYGSSAITKGPIRGVAVDARGRIYLADREHGRVTVYDKDGKELDHVDAQLPDKLAINPYTGALYVLEKRMSGFSKDAFNGRFCGAKVLKFAEVKAGATPSAEYDFGSAEKGADVTDNMQMAGSFTKDRSRLWINVGTKYVVRVLEDQGKSFESVQTDYQLRKDSQWGWGRLAADWERDEVYGLDGTVGIWRYDGKTGKGERLKKNGKPLLSQDLAVGYDGLLYVREGMGAPEYQDYSGPFSRYTRDLQPAPYQAVGTHVLSKYIYSREGPGYAEKGIGVGPDGNVYISWQFLGWQKYAVTGFGPDGKPLKGKHLEGKGDADNVKKGTPEDLTSAIIGPITGSNGGVRVDLDGNIYSGMWIWPKNVPAPEQWDKSEAYWCSVGSVFKFGPDGGFVTSSRKDWGSDTIVYEGCPQRTPGAKGIEGRSGSYAGINHCTDAFVEGAVAAYPGYAPFSHCSFAGNTCCTCRTPRFDLDRYGRLYIPNAIANSVRIVDNTGNEIVEFGKYGNFDSQYANPETEAGKAGKPAVAVPEIPLGWPVAAGVTKDAIYVADFVNRRGVRVEPAFAAEASCAIK
jgi:hypothetical protein